MAKLVGVALQPRLSIVEAQSRLLCQHWPTMTTLLPRRESTATSTGNHVGRTSEHSSMKGPAIMTGWPPLLTRRRLKGGQECHCLCRRLIEMSRLLSINADAIYLVKDASAFADDEYVVKDARFFVDELKTTKRWSQSKR
ncbi:hypothetical protein CJ030_MR1G008552 [Morella rubra]|uniref:Uncharacterized protein n=1 Tax=Morella rubra TaxID=262757 RepID=A0A6A1WMY2_9ROSI|nr:hypothetical protein CJ030_MR1G008552 [Morella rubra]